MVAYCPLLFLILAWIKHSKNYKFHMRIIDRAEDAMHNVEIFQEIESKYRD